MRAAFHLRLTMAASMVLGLAAGCAPPPPPGDPEALAEFQEANDPAEPTNRAFYEVNDALDTVLLRPLAQGYRYVTPKPVRDSVHNVLNNLGEPVALLNDTMQGKPKRAGDSAMRFLINSTVGIAGLFDVAEKLGYPTHDTDFGITLASWGVPDGPFLFLPVLGPTSPRNAAGFAGNILLDPLSQIGQGSLVNGLGWARIGMGTVDSRERVLDPIDQIKQSALDPYATFRSLYRQRRQSEIDNALADKRATTPVWFPQPAPASR